MNYNKTISTCHDVEHQRVIKKVSDTWQNKVEANDWINWHPNKIQVIVNSFDANSSDNNVIYDITQQYSCHSADQESSPTNITLQPRTSGLDHR